MGTRHTGEETRAWREPDCGCTYVPAAGILPPPTHLFKNNRGHNPRVADPTPAVPFPGQSPSPCTQAPPPCPLLASFPQTATRF